MTISSEGTFSFMTCCMFVLASLGSIIILFMFITNRNLLLCLIKILMNGERELKIACRKNNWLLFCVLLCSSLEAIHTRIS